MNIFEEFIDKVLSLFENDTWVRWIHDGTKFAYTQKDKEDNIVYASKSNHCAICLNINGCCFPKNNMPRYPQHFNCHCRIEPKNNIIFETECPIEKFENYIFKLNNYKSKKNCLQVGDMIYLTQSGCKKNFAGKQCKNIRVASLRSTN